MGPSPFNVTRLQVVPQGQVIKTSRSSLLSAHFATVFFRKQRIYAG
ncbi:hypothetical protein BN133_2690 [Cronobacter dublinensis 582]|nr:hypothetical protein BN133_2690 [Cronobacter dublinensis 582]